MGVANIKSEWVSGNLVFYEEAVGQSVTGDVLTIGTAAVKIGGTSQDVDFQWYATGSKSFILDAGAGTLVMAGLDVTITGDLTIDTEDINLGDGDDLEFGDSQDVLMRFSLADESDPAFVLALDDTSQQMHITDKAAVATDWARSAGTHPELAIHSNTTPITDYLAIGNHDGTTAHINVVGGTTLSLDIAGTPEVVIAAASTSPATSDSNALGTGTLMWSDLFLANEAVINFNNGDVTLTHSANTLTLAGGVLNLAITPKSLFVGADSDSAGSGIPLVGASWDTSQGIGFYADDGGVAQTGYTETFTTRYLLTATIASGDVSVSACHPDLTINGNYTGTGGLSSIWGNTTIKAGKSVDTSGGLGDVGGGTFGIDIVGTLAANSHACGVSVGVGGSGTKTGILSGFRIRAATGTVDWDAVLSIEDGDGSWTSMTTSGSNTATMTNSPKTGDPTYWLNVYIGETKYFFPVWTA